MGISRLLLVFFWLFVPFVSFGQLVKKEATGAYVYACNCFENRIVRGVAVELKYKSRNKQAHLFRIDIDTTYYSNDVKWDTYQTAYVITHDEQSADRLRASNVFVLRNMQYCAAGSAIVCRPVLYYEWVDGVYSDVKNVEIILRRDQLVACLKGTRMPDGSRKGNYDRLSRLEELVQDYRRKEGEGKK